MSLMLSRIIHILSKPLTGGNQLYFLLMYLLGLTGIVCEPWNGSRFWMSFELFSDLYLFCALLRLMPERYRHCLRLATATFFYLLSAVDMACYVRLGMPITPMLLQLALQSNTREAGEALSSYLDAAILWSPLGLVIIQMMVGMALLAREQTIMGKAMRTGIWRNRHMTYAAQTAIIVMFAIGFISSLENKEYMFCRIICQYSELETQQRKDFRQKTNYYLPIYRMAFAVSETHRLRDEIRLFEESLNKARIDSVTHLSPHIILIIGESYNRHHSQLYGYDKPTTPRQTARMNAGELIVFGDMTSAWNTTCESLKEMLSTQCAGQPGTWASAPPFPLLFRMAGYHTSFFSNQYMVKRSGFSDFIEDAFFNNPPISRRLFDTRNESTHDYDMALTDDYKRCQTRHPYTLDIFHFLGLHADFKKRYPANFGVFGAKDYDRADLTEQQREILAHYDNAIVYNDLVVDSILKLYEDEDAIAIFVADHGERIFDNSTEWGRNLTWDRNDIRQQFDIPFWIWASPSYRSCRKQLWEQIRSCRNRRGMTDTIAQLLLHLAGIHSPWYYPQYDILHNDYDNSRKRIIRGERDYDRIMLAP